MMGSGGVLSHAPRRVPAAAMLIDAFEPEGVTELAVDSVFMMPQLGVLSEHRPEAALEVFERDCIVRLGVCVAPVGSARAGEPCVVVHLEDGRSAEVAAGSMAVIPLGPGERCEMAVEASGAFDAGAGRGRRVVREVSGGEVGVVVDARGRPLVQPGATDAGRTVRRAWEESLALYEGRTGET